jgi:formyl-CoA transferase
MAKKASKKSKAKSRKPAPNKAAKRASAKAKKNGAHKNGALPRPSGKPYGQAGKALEGVRILEFTHGQSGPTCAQLRAWFGADVI